MDNMLLKFCNKNPVYTVPHKTKITIVGKISNKLTAG
jgi:hypothetical protein